MRESFRVSTAGAGFAPQVAVVRNHLYVSGGPSAVFDSVGVEGCSGAPRVCAPQWTINQNGELDVIDATLHIGSVAYDADGVRECSGTPKVCEGMWLYTGEGIPTGPVDPTKLHFQLGGYTFHGSEDLYLDGSLAPKDLSTCVTGVPGTIPGCRVAWTRALGGGPLGSRIGMPAQADGRIFASYSSPVSEQGTLFAFDGRDAKGPLLWSASLPGKGGPDIAVADGVVVTTVQIGLDWLLAAYDAAGVTNCSGSPKVCTPLWVSDTWTGGGNEVAPAIADGIVYRAVGSQLRAYDLHGQQSCSGTPVVCQRLWVASVGAGITAPAVANGLVYTGAADGSVEAFDARGITGCSATTRVCGPLWTTNVGAAAGEVVVSGGRVYAPAANGVVRVFAVPSPPVPGGMSVPDRGDETAHV
jgi:hypothetical protein